MNNGFSKRERAAWGGFLSTYSDIDRLIEADLQDHSQLSHVEFEVLLRLSMEEHQRLRIQDLAAQSILSRSGMSRVVARLEHSELVAREEASEDRRGAYAVLTEAGAERFNRAAEAHIAFVRQHFLSRFSIVELDQMASLWERYQQT